MFVISDISDNGAFWQQCALDTHEIKELADGFLITAPNGASMKGTVVHAKGDLRIQVHAT